MNYSINVGSDFESNSEGVLRISQYGVHKA